MQLAPTSSIRNDSLRSSVWFRSDGRALSYMGTTRGPQKQHHQSAIHTHGMRGHSLGWGIKVYTSLYNVGLRIFTGVFGREIF